MTSLETARYLCLGVPLAALAAVLLVRRPGLRERGALLLAGVAAAVGLLVLHELALAAGWWSYVEVAGSFRGLPVDMWLGWAVLWGPLPVALRRVVGLPGAVAAALWLDVLAMPRLAPLVELGERWLLGEAVGLTLVLVPAALLGRWSADDVRLRARVALQVGVFAALGAWVLPTVAFELGDGGWSHVLDRPWWQQAALLQAALLLAAPGLAAVRELCVRGHGTPYPWDPPRRLVTTGPYAYLANPMQTSMVALLGLLAAAGRSWSLLAAGIVAVAFCQTVAAPHEDEVLASRWGPAWRAHRARTPAWRPRWRPVPAAHAPATLWVAADCELCGQVGASVAHLGLDDVRLADAAGCPARPRRLRYEAADGHADEGVGALARTLGHVNLAAAWLGWIVLLPGVRGLAQLISDTVAMAPREPTATGREVAR